MPARFPRRHSMRRAVPEPFIATLEPYTSAAGALIRAKLIPGMLIRAPNKRVDVGFHATPEAF